MKLFAKDLIVSRGELILIDDLSLEIEAGEVLIVTGPNGSGKSTLLRTIAGFLKPNQGEIGIEPDTDQPVGEHCHYLGHRNGLKSGLSAAQNLQFWYDFSENKGLSPIEALERVELLHIANLPAGYLSAGQKRRVAIARLLVSNRPIWLVDEPTAALDTNSDEIFAELLKLHLQNQGLAIAATHQPLGVANARSLDLAHYRAHSTGAA